MIRFLPTFKDNKGNRFIIVASNMVFDSHDDATLWHLGNFIWYVPFGLTNDGIFETEVGKDGSATFPHVFCNGPMGADYACISGPIFDEGVSGANGEAIAELERYREAHGGSTP